MKEKKKKLIPQKNVKTSRDEVLQLKLHQRNKHRGSFCLERYSEAFLKWKRKELKQEEKKVDDDAQGLLHPREEMKKEEDSPVFRMA